MSQSFQRLKEVLGFGGEQKTRVIPMVPAEELAQRREEEYKDNIVRTSKYNFVACEESDIDVSCYHTGWWRT